MKAQFIKRYEKYVTPTTYCSVVDLRPQCRASSSLIASFPGTPVL
jgi:hypothetical protein